MLSSSWTCLASWCSTSIQLSRHSTVPASPWRAIFVAVRPASASSTVEAKLPGAGSGESWAKVAISTTLSACQRLLNTSASCLPALMSSFLQWPHTDKPTHNSRAGKQHITSHQAQAHKHCPTTQESSTSHQCVVGQSQCQAGRSRAAPGRHAVSGCRHGKHPGHTHGLQLHCLHMQHPCGLHGRLYHLPCHSSPCVEAAAAEVHEKVQVA